MHQILFEDKPPTWNLFRASAGWVTGFKKRYRISYQCLTNKKSTHILEKLPLIKKFHRFLADLQMSQGPPQSSRCIKYGRFPAHRRFHMDQVPLAFVLDSERTLSSIGESVWMAVPKGSGLAKRQATLQVCIRPEGEQLVKLLIIFRGTGSRLNQEERDLYASLAHLISIDFQVACMFFISTIMHIDSF